MNRKLKLSLSNGIFTGRALEENIASVRDLGFENLEFNMKSVEVEDDMSVYRAKKLINEYGLNCQTVHAATSHIKDAVEVHREIYYGRISLEFARELSAPIMVVHSNVSRKLPEQERNRLMSAIFMELVPLARNLKVKLALENLSYASSVYGKNVAELEEILEAIDEKGSIGLTLDFCHAEATGQTLALLKKFHDRLLNVHLSNRAHKPFTSPTTSLLTFANALREYRYDGVITLELSRECRIEDIQATKSVVEDVFEPIETE